MTYSNSGAVGRPLLLALALSACGHAGSPAPQAQAPQQTKPRMVFQCAAPSKPMATLQPGKNDTFPSASCIAKARALTSKLTPEQKFGQMMQPDRGTVRDPADVARYGYGSILSGGGSGPTQNTPLAWAKMVNAFRESSLKTAHKIPVMYGIDAVHGHSNVHGAVIFPHNIGLGASRNPDLVERIGRATAEAVSGTNIDWTFSPVLAVARDERWGRTYEAYGETSELAELLGPAMIRGLQGERLGKQPNSVLACAKHFIADGNTDGGKDQGDSQLTQEQVIKQLLPAYRAAIDAGVGSVMASYNSINGVKMHCNGPLLNDTLKVDLGFGGFVVSDWEAIEKLPGNYPSQLAAALNAGIDLVMAPKVRTDFIKVMKQIVPSAVPMARVDDAVTRILTAKCELGMLEPSRYSRDRSGQLQIPQSLGTIGGKKHRALAREAVSQSLVLLKNSGALPIKKAAHIHLAGAHANDVGLQSGGWTITWQGAKGAITPGTTLLEAFQRAAKNVSYSADAPAATKPDINVLVVGERPYAEMQGDDPDLELPDKALALAKKLKSQGVPLVVVLISGRPMMVGPLMRIADAFVAAWLPGTEGQGVSDVLLGDQDFAGTLPHTWPRSVEQIPINYGDENYDPLFEYGYGLNYAGERIQPAPASETPADPPNASETPAAPAASSATLSSAKAPTAPTAASAAPALVPPTAEPAAPETTPSSKAPATIPSFDL